MGENYDFYEVKEKYEEAREEQRRQIVDCLKCKGYNVTCRGGKGLRNYTSGGNLIKPYDLSNWKWVEAKKGGVYYLVSLQVLDEDPVSGNMHVLMDRLGVCCYHKYDSKYVLENVRTTDIDLPMDIHKFERLFEFMA